MQAPTALLLAATLVSHLAADLNGQTLVPRPLPAPTSKTTLARKTRPTPPPPLAPVPKTSPMIEDQAVILEIRRAPASTKPTASKPTTATATQILSPPSQPKDGEVRIQRSGRQISLPLAQ
jgi:hypothetical protein